MTARRRKPAKEAPGARSGAPAQTQLSLVQAAFSGGALWLSLALVAITAIVYAPVGHFGFLNWDDQDYVTDNPHVLHGLTWRGVAWAFTTGHAFNWHPLTWLSHMSDVDLFGMNPGGHHLTSLVLHLASTVLLFGVLHQMTGARGCSAFVAALFAVHPLHVESVAWVAERKDVLSGLFAMLTLAAYVAYVRRPHVRRYVTLVLVYACGLMAKPMLVTLPFVLLLLDLWPLRRLPATDQGSLSAWRARVREKMPLFALAAASSVITLLVQRRGGSVVPLDRMPLGFRLENAAVSAVAYVVKMLWPSSLAALYPLPASIPGWQVAAATLFLAGASLAAVLQVRRRPYLFVGWFWYVGMLVPVIGLVQVGGQARADRYTYLPLIGLFIAVAWLIPELPLPERLRGAPLGVVAVGAVLACAACARAYLPSWTNTITLWQRAVEATRDNYRAHDELGIALAREGNVDEAIAHYAEALRIRPDFAPAHNNLGNALTRKGRFGEAVNQFAAALRVDPNYAEAHNGMGGALARQGALDASIREFAEAITIDPNVAGYHYNLGLALERARRDGDAAAEYEAALRLDPQHQGALQGLSRTRR
ncbi:MAG TPA: tetratricopeptide repeat protein [Thermoanaerobaculaceae bacterium]|nr:tetratricopeptide repeat protein [Thermoanaerobaculaceae bacterium]